MDDNLHNQQNSESSDVNLIEKYRIYKILLYMFVFIVPVFVITFIAFINENDLQRVLNDTVIRIMLVYSLILIPLIGNLSLKVRTLVFVPVAIVVYIISGKLGFHGESIGFIYFALMEVIFFFIVVGLHFFIKFVKKTTNKISLALLTLLGLVIVLSTTFGIFYHREELLSDISNVKIFNDLKCKSLYLVTYEEARQYCDTMVSTRKISSIKDLCFREIEGLKTDKYYTSYHIGRSTYDTVSTCKEGKVLPEIVNPERCDLDPFYYDGIGGWIHPVDRDDISVGSYSKYECWVNVAKELGPEYCKRTTLEESCLVEIGK